MVGDNEKSEDRLSFDEYMAQYGYSPSDEAREQPDDPEAVGSELASETIKIIRQGLTATALNCASH